MLTFKEGLIIFSAILTLIFLLLLLLSEKMGQSFKETSLSEARWRIIVATVIMLEILSLFKVAIIQFVLPLIVVGLILYLLRASLNSKSRNCLLLSLAILYHIILVYNPPSSVNIYERTNQMILIANEGRWNPNWETHPIYRPFPMALYIFYVTSTMLGIDLINFNSWIIYLPFIVAYDLIIFALTKRVTDNYMAGLLAIFILATTPPANITLHPAKWFGNLLVLIFVFTLVRVLKDPATLSYKIIIVVSYLVAIFMHPSAILGIFVLLSILVVRYLNTTIGRNDTKAFFGSTLLCILTVLLFTVTLTRIIYTARYMKVIADLARSLLTSVFGMGVTDHYTSPFQQTVNPIQAYSWSIPISMASALIAYNFIKGKIRSLLLLLSIYLAGMIFLLIGYLFGGNASDAMYVGFPLLMPVSAVLGLKVLKAPKPLSVIFIILMILFTEITLNDPMINREAYKKTGATDIEGGLEDFLVAKSLANILPSGESLYVPYEIRSSLSCLSAKSMTDLKYYNIATTSEKERQIIEMVRNKELLSNVTYIWVERLLPDVRSYLNDVLINIFYDSSKYTIFRKL
jgi:hypothetical protein